MEFNQSNEPSMFGSPLPEQPTPPKLSRRARKKRKAEDGAVGAELVTKKVVSRQMRWALVFALLVGVVAAVGMFSAQSGGQYVVRANQDIGAGSAVNPDTMLEVVQISDDDLIQDGAFAGKSEAEALKLAKEELAGMHAQYPISASQQLTEALFNVELILDEPLGVDERLVSVQANIANAVAGRIKPGDRVDIAASTQKLTGIVLEDVEIVSVTVSENQYQALASQQTGENKNARAEDLLPGAPIPGIYVLRVPAEDAPALMAVNAGADLSLMYRPEGGDSLPSGPLTAEDVLCADGGIKACDS